VSTISYPFTLSPLGVLESTENPIKVYTDRLLTLLSTSPGQRPMLPEYGTDVLRALYENDNQIELSINQAVRSAVAVWIPEIEIEEINVTLPDEDGTASVEILIQLPNSTLTTLSVSTALFNLDGTISATEL
jgi:phage baseplate assembly protein W